LKEEGMMKEDDGGRWGKRKKERVREGGSC
jgi:hypothetical protein